MSITSGLSPVRGYANGGMSEEEQFKDAMKEQGIAKLEEALGIRLPRGSEESEEALINNILGNVTDLPIQKRGDEYTYGDDDGFSFYVNPEEEGAGVRYNKRFAQGGLAAYANGGDVNTERQNMLAKLGFPSGITNEQLDAAIAKEKNAAYLPESQEPGTTVGQLPGLFKENVFDPTDPVDYATLPFLSLKAAKLLGKAGKKVYDTVRGSGGKVKENLRGIGAYVGTDMIADEIRGDDAFFNKTEEKGLEDDALDQAKDDLNVVNANEKEDQSDPFFTQKEDGSFESTAPEPGKDKELTKKEKGINAFAALAETYGDLKNQYSSTPGYMIEGTGASIPEITRYQEGGIANMDPMMMAGGGIAKFGKEVIKKTAKGIKKLAKDKLDKRAKDKAAKAKAKAKAKVDKDKAAKAKAKADAKETGVTKDKPVDPRDSFVPVPLQPIISGAAEIGKKVFSPTKYSPSSKQFIGGTLVPSAIGATALNAYANRGEEEQTEKEKADAQALLDKAAAEKAYKERQEAREGLTSMPDIIRARSLERAQAAGRSEPTFVDYIASFPASYSEKIGKDPEFAKQMMAGFAAMTKTTEGYAPRNAFTDFTQGVQEERVRQDEGMSDQLKLLKETQNNPDIAKQLRNLNRPEIASNDLSALMSNVKRKVGDRLGIKLKDTDILVDPDTNLTIGELDLEALYNSEGPEAVLKLSNRLIYKEV